MNRYDLNLQKWTRAASIESGDVVYSRGSELRLGRYLMTAEEFIEAYITKATHVLVGHGEEPWGEIVGVIFEDELSPFKDNQGYWVVENLGEVDIFPGQNSHRPVRLDS